EWRELLQTGRLVHESLVPSGDNGQAFVKGKRPLGSDIDVAAEDIHARVLRAGAQEASVVGRTQACDSSGQDDVRACGVGGNIPAGAGHVPVEFVMILEEAQAVANAIMKRDISRRILCGGDIDLQLEISGVPLLFDAKGGAVGISGGDVGK